MPIMPNLTAFAMRLGKQYTIYVFALDYGAGNELFYYGDWIRKPGVAICSCHDGFRPVIFKLEATNEPNRQPYPGQYNKTTLLYSSCNVQPYAATPVKQSLNRKRRGLIADATI